MRQTSCTPNEQTWHLFINQGPASGGVLLRASVHLVVWAEIKCTVHVALPKQPITKLKLDQQFRQQALRPYFPNIIYTVYHMLPTSSQLLHLFSHTTPAITYTSLHHFRKIFFGSMIP